MTSCAATNSPPPSPPASRATLGGAEAPTEPNEPEGEALQVRTVWISDLHLGTPGCQAMALLDFLRCVECETLYLVGDIIDGWQLRRQWYWPQAHNDVVQKLLRKARKGTRVIFVPGNHDEFARRYVDHNFGGVEVVDECDPRDRRRPAAVGHPRRPVRRRDPVRQVAGLRRRLRLRVHAQGSTATSTRCARGWACRTGACRATSSSRSSARSATSATSSRRSHARRASAACTASSAATSTTPRCATSTASCTATTATGSRA